jgi:transposase
MWFALFLPLALSDASAMDASNSLFSPEEIAACSNSVPVADAPLPEPARPRLRLPRRDQGQMFLESLDERLDLDHPARIVWKFVEKLDLSIVLRQVKAVEGQVGRDHTDPRILVGVWLFAVSEGVGSARKLETLCAEHRPYEWLCGGVSVNYHMLADFRTRHGDLLDDLLVQSLASLSHEKLLDVNVVAIDGMRTRASAGSDSFRREATLEKHREDARKHLENLNAERELNPQELSARQRAAQERAARERLERLDKAIDNVREITESRESRKAGSGEEARASSTDPESRKMKMPDGGFRPAFNVQFATEVGSGLIVGADVTNAGTDASELGPMLEGVRANTGKTPESVLADGGYYSRENLDQAEQLGTKAYMPLKQEKKALEQGKDPYAPKKNDTPEQKKLRERMKAPESKAFYKLRGQAVEWANAQARNWGMQQFKVRGQAKARLVAIWFVLAHNLFRGEALRAARAAESAPEAKAN